MFISGKYESFNFLFLQSKQSDCLRGSQRIHHSWKKVFGGDTVNFLENLSYHSKSKWVRIMDVKKGTYVLSVLMQKNNDLDH